jgi:hypothetical protein
LKDFLPIKPGQLDLHPEWRFTMEQRELALSKLTEHTKTQQPLKIGQSVLV